MRAIARRVPAWRRSLEIKIIRRAGHPAELQTEERKRRRCLAKGASGPVSCRRQEPSRVTAGRKRGALEARCGGGQQRIGDGGEFPQQAVDIAADARSRPWPGSSPSSQAGKKGTTTRSPGFHAVTSAPTATTSPAPSESGTRGSVMRDCIALPMSRSQVVERDGAHADHHLVRARFRREDVRRASGGRGRKLRFQKFMGKVAHMMALATRVELWAMLTDGFLFNHSNFFFPGI